MDVNNNVETYHSSSWEPMRTDTEYTAGAYTTVGLPITHHKTWVEHLEEYEHRRFGTGILSFLYNNFVAGWRAGLLRAFLFSLAALALNISIFLWLFLEYGPVRGNGTINTSNCDEVGNLETGIKVGLNVVSTLILGASTYAMQGTTAPTREEVDSAHSKGKWLEIGTQSWRNLIYVSKRHASIWSILAITSLPLHLVFNAVFFTTTETYQYAVAVVDQGFLQNAEFQATSENSSPTLPQFERFVWNGNCDGNDCSWDINNDGLVRQLLDDVRDSSRAQAYKRLERPECIESYTEGFMQKYSDVVVVSNITQVDTPVLWTRYSQRNLSKDKKDTNQDPFHWVCHDMLKNSVEGPDRCSRGFAKKHIKPEQWTVYGHPVDYCFARVEPELCHLQYNAYIMLAVVVFSVIKVLAIAFLVVTHPKGDFLRTMGDAITSFLKKQDETTKDMCLVSSAQIRKQGFQSPYSPQTFTNARPRWWTGANTTEFFSTIGISAGYVVILSSTLYWAISETDGTAFDSGLGRPNIQSLANLRPDNTKSSTIVPTILTANIPQVGFSLLYVFYTNIWSKLLIAYEFDRLTRVQKGLRVSERSKGQQRASHFFTLPTRYALPLMAVSAALHYLCSQSLFMARFDGMRDGNIDPQDQMVRLGYSATGMIALISVNFAMMVVTICVAGFRRLSTGLGEMSMSVVISAACHIKRPEYEPWLQAVQWGDVSGGIGEMEGGQDIRHCAFTSLSAERPIEGHIYR
ncbi:uncharacterized protein EKO05_0000336 [Ascochyta rabiei]|uniref:uncharacterized protein n=1 Tax=Didymella rabiei TaxID=5454 RepID=UPI00220BF10A|nr:uncharacterized protein EKO05_0000336 [Ascochyta rabiei]UPX09651.1 hypothetical protein EKO05_0000336 [Ascochyta rabiei]